MNEFSLISKYFKPLAENFSGSLELSDDAAILTQPAGCELVITKDALSEGVHFLGNENPALIAGKALRVNISDLAAMGATPICYFLALILPRDTSEEWLEKFALGLKQTQKEFNISLAGGDTTATNATLSISITAIGSIPNGTALRRNGAKIGDDIYVSGTLGDSALGLELLQKGEKNDFLINRYLTPQPRIKLGIALRGVANSAMDISDGLVQDLEHICTASNVGATIYSDKIPLSVKGELQAALTGGDDYELLFTASPDKKTTIEQLAESLSLPLTYIGKITSGNAVQVLDKTGRTIELKKKGFSHF
ncbi:MAG: thiamine-phosphate kinase [Rickettsiales bacterium]|jgi:thiamine-monophosphate kinase